MKLLLGTEVIREVHMDIIKWTGNVHWEQNGHRKWVGMVLLVLYRHATLTYVRMPVFQLKSAWYRLHTVQPKSVNALFTAATSSSDTHGTMLL